MTVSTFTPSADTFVEQIYSPSLGQMNGNATTMVMGHNYTTALYYAFFLVVDSRTSGLLKFDLSSISSSAEVRSANLRLYGHSIGIGSTLSVYRNKRAWVETQATGYIYSTGNNWQERGAQGELDTDSELVGSESYTGGTDDRYIYINLNPSLVEDLIEGVYTNGFTINGPLTYRQSAFVTYTKEHSNSDYWPLLTIEYDTVNAAANGSGCMKWF